MKARCYTLPAVLRRSAGEVPPVSQAFLRTHRLVQSISSGHSRCSERQASPEKAGPVRSRGRSQSRPAPSCSPAHRRSGRARLHPSQTRRIPTRPEDASRPPQRTLRDCRRQADSTGSAATTPSSSGPSPPLLKIDPPEIPGAGYLCTAGAYPSPHGLVLRCLPQRNRQPVDPDLPAVRGPDFPLDDFYAADLPRIVPVVGITRLRNPTGVFAPSVLVRAVHHQVPHSVQRVDLRLFVEVVAPQRIYE
eukprot:CAMPEP_0194296948 /NCGR_PEP_ID=MMETSP0169-20130528/57559_1 /TAXON_ID=218684 /ORGANISM="Corethron pennatum, Strain L29A3" /LENGTH=247 /DNA_ID=CAMNT_0039046599 /DNA_START=161 /DNA_END=905 /DNA_ORIENTATION=-